MYLDGYRWLEVSSCVTIRGTRGGLDPGALLKARNRTEYGPVFHVVGQYVRFEGLRFEGPVTTDDRRAIPGHVTAIWIGDGASSVQIDNNTFSAWSIAVYVGHSQPHMTKDDAPLISVTRNYFNRNAVDRNGYGVGVFNGYALIEGNLFNGNRHAVAASWNTDGGKGYIARHNYVLQKGFTVCWPCHYNQHFDVHGQFENGQYGGTAGEYFEIAHNTIRGEQKYYGNTRTRAAFMLRGKPTRGAFFHDNVVVHDNPSAAVRLKNAGCGTAAQCNLTVGPNTYNADTTNELAAGDFDGDGRDDVFLANGTGWWYSSAGLTEWRFLRPSSLRIKDLRFGRFNSDARTDVLFSDGANWWVSHGGTGQPTVLRSDGTRLTDCVFGDFNGDGLTDALRADGSFWSVALGADAPWMVRRRSRVIAANMRVGDFTGDRVDDIFWIEDNTWHVWELARSRSDQRMRMPRINIHSLVVADFDGDRLADIAQTYGRGWRWMRGGTNAWALLRGSGGQEEYKYIQAALLGRFTPNSRRLNAIRYGSPRFGAAFKDAFVLWGGIGARDAFVPWTPAWQEMR
jgi:hypothetical protein